MRYLLTLVLLLYACSATAQQFPLPYSDSVNLVQQILNGPQPRLAFDLDFKHWHNRRINRIRIVMHEGKALRTYPDCVSDTNHIQRRDFMHLPSRGPSAYYRAKHTTWDFKRHGRYLYASQQRVYLVSTLPTYDSTVYATVKHRLSARRIRKILTAIQRNQKEFYFWNREQGYLTQTVDIGKWANIPSTTYGYSAAFICGVGRYLGPRSPYPNRVDITLFSDQDSLRISADIDDLVHDLSNMKAGSEDVLNSMVDTFYLDALLGSISPMPSDLKLYRTCSQSSYRSFFFRLLPWEYQLHLFPDSHQAIRVGE